MIGLLNCYRQSENAPTYQLDYEPMFLSFLSRVAADIKVKVYRVALGQLPLSPAECNAWIISGSPKGAYDEDPWISNLGKFIVAADQAQSRMVGICFGHQLIAHVLGGRAEKSPSGWGVGVQDFEISNFKPWMSPKMDKASLLFSHQDQVTKLPNGAEHLASNQFCRYQMYSVNDHIFGMQGHPEFTAEFARGRLDARKDIIGHALYDKAVNTLGKSTASSQIGQWLRQFLSQDSK